MTNVRQICAHLGRKLQVESTAIELRDKKDDLFLVFSKNFCREKSLTSAVFPLRYSATHGITESLQMRSGRANLHNWNRFVTRNYFGPKRFSLVATEMGGVNNLGSHFLS